MLIPEAMVNSPVAYQGLVPEVRARPMNTPFTVKPQLTMINYLHTQKKFLVHCELHKLISLQHPIETRVVRK